MSHKIEATTIGIAKELHAIIGVSQTFKAGDRVNVYSWNTKEVEDVGTINHLFMDNDGEPCARIVNWKGKVLYEKNTLFTCQVIKF